MMNRTLAPLFGLLLVTALLACGEDGPPLRNMSAEATTVQARPGAGGVDAPRAGAMDAGYRLGSPDAPVAVVEFSDFGCPYCGRFAQSTFRDLQQQYIDAGLVRWRYVPVSFGFAGGAAMGAAAVCAADQAGEDGFWRAHAVLYRHQAALRGPEAPARILEWLAAEGMDASRLTRCISDPATAAVLQRNNQLAAEWLVRGTPTFLINGVPMSGALPTEFFQKVLDTALDPSGL
jgi:protein-disulfide isomerase